MSRISIIKSFAIHDVLKSKGLFFLIIISMGVALTAMITTASVLEGFNSMLSQGAIGWLGDIIIRPVKGDLSIKNITDIKKELNAISEIKSYSVRSYSMTSIKYADTFHQPFGTVGIIVADEEKTSTLKNNVVEGNFVDESRPNEIVLGETLARDLEGDPYGKKRAGVGTEVDIITSYGTTKKYKIGGIIDAKNFNPNWLVIFTKSELEKLDSSQKNSEIAIKLNDAKDIDKVKGIIQDKNLGVRVYTWQEQSGYVNDIISGVSFITIILNGLVVISVFILVSIIIFINILQKRRQIGILKSMGTNNRFVTSAYLFETLIYLFFSSVIGIGMFLLINAYSNAHPIPILIGDFHTIFNIELIKNSLIVMCIASIGGTLLPARAASKIQIADVIRDNT